MTLAFFLPCIPPRTSHHAKRIVRVGRFTKLADKPELVAAKAMLDEMLLRHQPSAPVSGPVHLSLEFTWPWLAGDSLRLRKQGRTPHTSKPDCSNVLKTLEDRLVALRFLEDDRFLVTVTVTKFRGERPGIRVAIVQVAESLAVA